MIYMKNQPTLKLRNHIFERDDYRCIYCGALGQETDHVIPVKDKGPTISSNLVCCCKKCNCQKSHQMFSNSKWLQRAIYWLIIHGENTKWMDDWYKP